ncbi:MAG: ATP-binding cassette domain-containing protein, partial [Chloroflexi bacterium]
EGDFVAVVGANGSGKSTFARLVSALLVPNEGAVRVAGIDTRRPENRARIHATVGMVFQFHEDQIV